MNKQTLMKEYQAWLAKVRANPEINLVEYKAPCCGYPLATFAPDATGQMWDSLATCPNCGALYMKYVYVDHVDTHILTAKQA